jgi:pimeloyl-ACP methyl ester carboxylesterase
LVIAFVAAGCSSSRWTQLRREPHNPLTPKLVLDSRQGPRPTPRTMQLLRREDLVELLDGDPSALLAEVQRIATAEPTADNVYAIAELAYIGATRLEQQEQAHFALDLHGTVVANSYFYLFDESFRRQRNAYDPRFRTACELYNKSLESMLRQVQRQGQLRPGGRCTIQTPKQTLHITIASRDTWHENSFSELKFVSDFDVRELKNSYQTFGLGVPLIAVYQPRYGNTPLDRFYPPGMSFPVTAFMRVLATSSGADETRRLHYQCVVELYDPVATAHVPVAGEMVPLETDLTTPLAYSLENPAFKEANVPWNGLRDPEQSSAVSGLYMLEPYDPQKIPVVMIHGFWSSLVTWMEMFNDLRGSKDIRDTYQFWFYLYPTGPPFWYSAAHLRQELALIRQALDPDGRATPLDQLILVGHSMGGLVAMLQTIESGNQFWQLVSERPLAELRAPPETRHNLTRTFYFHPNPSVRRVITIATPHQGSNVSNLATQWLGRQLIHIPNQLVQVRSGLLAENPNYFPAHSLLHITTSVDALAPLSPVFDVIGQAPHAPWTTYHNIVGQVDDKRVLGVVASGSDGVVSVASATCPAAVSSVTVGADHTSIHQHPRTILEVRRILREARQEQSPNPKSQL